MRAEPSLDHLLRLDYHTPQLDGSCSCGRWTQRVALTGPELTLRTFAKIHDDHRVHARQADEEHARRPLAG